MPPAWNTGKPLSPKLVIMNLRDHMFAKAPYFLDGKESPLENTPPEGGLGEKVRGEKHSEEHSHEHVPESGFERIPPADSPLQATRPLVGTLEEGGVIDPTCCGRAPPAGGRASSSARSTSSTSTTSSTCAATR